MIAEGYTLGELMPRILITGSAGLIGSALARRLEQLGHSVSRLDTRAEDPESAGSILDASAVTRAMDQCAGVVHLAAVSRVIWGEQDPDLCHQVNVPGTQNILTAAMHQAAAPWVLVGSSREVYGQARDFPVPETAELHPMNAYAISKAKAEGLVAKAQSAGLRASVVRFSSVYGSAADHPDRVVPAFARAAASGDAMRIDGADTVLDFTHVTDVVEALKRAIQHLCARRPPLQTLQFVSGRGTSLEALAKMAIESAGRGSFATGRPRTFDVQRFVGDPARAAEVLGWRATTPLEEGVSDLIAQFAQAKW